MLRSLPLIFKAKVSTIEEMKDLKDMKMDELHGILTVYEMRIRKEKLGLKEVVFKASKKTKGHKDHDHSSSESNEEEV